MVWPIIASMYLGNVALLVMNLPMVPLFANLLRTPYKVLYPGILLISVVGVYGVHFAIFDVWMLVVFGLLGYVMKKLDIPPAPLVLAFVLAPIAENAIRQSLLLSDTSPAIYLERPISAVLLAMSPFSCSASASGASTACQENRSSRSTTSGPVPQSRAYGAKKRRNTMQHLQGPSRCGGDRPTCLARGQRLRQRWKGSASEGGEPTNTEVVTHDEVGGGSDVFTRQVIKILAVNDIDSQWPVKNIPAATRSGPCPT